MAACLRSLRLGIPPLVPGGAAGGGIHLGRRAEQTRRVVQSISSLHITTTHHKATPAPQQQQQQQQQRKVEGGREGLHRSTPFHSFHPLDFPPCPSAHTLDDIEVQCATSDPSQQSKKQPNSNTGEQADRSIRTFSLPPNAIWYPKESKHLQNGSILYSVSYSQLETEVMDCISERPYIGQDPPETPPLPGIENGGLNKNRVDGIVGDDGACMGGDNGCGAISNVIKGCSEMVSGGTEEKWENECAGNRDNVDRGDGHRGAREEGRTETWGGENVEGSKRGGVYDMDVFIKEMGLRETEVQLCSVAPFSLSCSSLASSSPSSSSSSPSGNVDPSGKPSPEQLSFVFNKLAESLPRLFTQPLDYTIYAQDIVFENRIRGVRTVGLFSYVRQVALLRTIGHLKFAYVKFEILKITKHPEEGTVKVRWRIKGLSGLKAILQFWKIKIWDWKSVEQQMVSWYDGFSTFHIASDGLIHLHVADSMMPDEEAQVVNKGPLAVKMAALLGLVPRPSSSNLNTTPDTSAPPPIPSPAPVKAIGSESCEGFNTTTTTAACAGSGLLGLFHEERESCSGLMLPLEKIF